MNQDMQHIVWPSCWRGAALVCLTLLVTACGKASGPQSAAVAGSVGNNASLSFPTAIIDFEQARESPALFEKAITLAQDTCIELKAAENRPVKPQRVTPDKLLNKTRLVRAYYDGSRMAWYETEQHYQVNDETCEVGLSRGRQVTVVRGAEVFTFTSGDGEPAHVERASTDFAEPGLPIESPQTLRNVAGQPCVFDPQQTAVLGALQAEICYWGKHPGIRDGALSRVPLYQKSAADAIEAADGALVWQAISIRETQPPEAVFAAPSVAKPPSESLFLTLP
jgi:hypothetical protein